MAGPQLDERRTGLLALFNGNRAARVKAAACGRIDGRGHVAFDMKPVIGNI